MDVDEITEQVWQNNKEALDRKTLGIDLSLQNVVEMVVEEVQDRR